MAWKCPDNIDKHPLRHTLMRQSIEDILARRLHQKRLDGYTLETSLEIAEMAEEFLTAKPF